MKNIISEFKDFISKGRTMDMAVGIIIGGAFTSIVNSLTNSIINPLITFIAGGSEDRLSSLVVPGTQIDFGSFISSVINFLLVAAVVFLLVKFLNHFQSISKKVVETVNSTVGEANAKIAQNVKTAIDNASGLAGTQKDSDAENEKDTSDKDDAEDGAVMKDDKDSSNKGENAPKKEDSETDKDKDSKPRVCPYCLEEIKPGATRCPHCTASLAT